MALVPAMMGCSSAGMHSRAQDASDLAAQDVELTALRAQVEQQEQELRTLQGRLALAQAEVHELQGSGRRAPSARAPSLGKAELPWAEELIVEERLATTANVPDLPTFEEPAPPAEPTEPAAAKVPAPAPVEVSVEGYRRGLRLVRDRKFDEALQELDAFYSANQGHPYADNALFWCGEIHYLRHEYTQALEDFERLQKLHPWGNKAPDALYRMGQIHLRRGDRARARAYFDKVREQFPDTAAARLALREDAS